MCQFKDGSEIVQSRLWCGAYLGPTKGPRVMIATQYS